MKKLLIVSVLTSFLVSGVVGDATASPAKATGARQLIFDDFHYRSHRELTKNGWIVRSIAGWPGVPGALWGDEAISFVADPDVRNNRFVRMTASTAGTAETTRQAQLCHERKYLEGTYAARVRFTDDPVAGPGGDQVVETFYMISPQKAPMDLDYSEIDFEYLPNGGWGRPRFTLFATTWETFQLEPWKADNDSHDVARKLSGWHTLVTQVGSTKVKYFLDGKPFVEHEGRVFPESFMSINFNLWFIKGGLLKSNELRRYEEDIDWVFFDAASNVSPKEVEARVSAMRRSGVRFKDTVRSQSPPLVSPCNF
ncbi:MAG TPA: glycoside hydrolase family 16 protein [Thermoanaerobaculia bacterium]|nr:glycoside hydrolase family 16 protein [Thermoanaerobaculia bacterium]